MNANATKSAKTAEHVELGQQFKALKARFLACFAIQSSHVGTWRQVVCALTDDFGISRRTLKEWALQAGYDKKYLSAVLSKILVSIGRRERAPGAGRKASPEVEEMLAISKRRFGNKYLRVLAAALKTGKAREEAENFSEKQQVALALLVGTNKDSKGGFRELAVFQQVSPAMLTTGGRGKTLTQIAS